MVAVPSFKLPKVVDATGAGDAFLGGLIAGPAGASVVSVCVASILNDIYLADNLTVHNRIYRLR